MIFNLFSRFSVRRQLSLQTYLMAVLLFSGLPFYVRWSCCTKCRHKIRRLVSNVDSDWMRLQQIHIEHESSIRFNSLMTTIVSWCSLFSLSLISFNTKIFPAKDWAYFWFVQNKLMPYECNGNNNNFKFLTKMAFFGPNDYTLFSNMHSITLLNENKKGIKNYKKILETQKSWLDGFSVKSNRILKTSSSFLNWSRQSSNFFRQFLLKIFKF